MVTLGLILIFSVLGAGLFTTAVLVSQLQKQNSQLTEEYYAQTETNKKYLYELIARSSQFARALENGPAVTIMTADRNDQLSVRCQDVCRMGFSLDDKAYRTRSHVIEDGSLTIGLDHQTKKVVYLEVALDSDADKRNEVLSALERVESELVRLGSNYGQIYEFVRDADWLSSSEESETPSIEEFDPIPLEGSAEFPLQFDVPYNPYAGIQIDFFPALDRQEKVESIKTEISKVLSNVLMKESLDKEELINHLQNIWQSADKLG